VLLFNRLPGVTGTAGTPASDVSAWATVAPNIPSNAPVAAAPSMPPTENQVKSSNFSQRPFLTSPMLRAQLKVP